MRTNYFKVFFRILLLVVCLVHTTTVFAQKAKTQITISTTKEVSTILDMIEKSTDYTFFYSPENALFKQKKTIKCSNATIDEVMSILLKDSGMTYKMFNTNNVVISPKTPSTNTIVSGVVSDENGPVPGVFVKADVSSLSTVTDNNGRYAIDLKGYDGMTLAFSTMGYQTVIRNVVPGMSSDITLIEEDIRLNESVVIGYSIIKRKDLTGAIASVSTDQLATTPSSSLSEMLRGRASGVEVISNTGQPGAVPQIRIRGQRSMSSGANAPLYIVDGAPVTAEEFASVSSTDIQSVEVLKDAAAQSIYGARAANGVILVTTKRGTTGGTKVTYEGYMSVQSLWKNFDLYNAKEWYDLRTVATAHDMNMSADLLSPSDVLTDSVMEKALAEGKSTDWEKLMLGNAFMHDHKVNIRGGSGKMKVSAGAEFLDQDGILKIGSGFKRGNVRLNLDYNFFKWLDFGVSSSYTKSMTKVQEGNFYEYITCVPLGMPYDESGKTLPYINSSLYVNPIYRAEHMNHQQKSDVARIVAFFEVKPFKNFVYKLNMSYSNTVGEDGVYKDSSYPGGGAAGSVSYTNRQYSLLENIINYDVPFKSNNHRLHFTAMQGIDYTYNGGLVVTANEFPVDRDWNMIGDATPTKVDRTYREVTLLSYLFHTQYVYKDKYMFTAGMRYDGSSKFGDNNKWGFFPSTSAAWTISEENWMKNLKAINNLKLRLSIGQVGNQNGIDPYTTQGLTNSYPMEFGNNLVIGYLPGVQLSNPNLKWETTTSTNLGLDFSLFNDRVYGTIEGYLTSTKDLLVTRSINSALGYSSILDNLGQTRTKGVDFSIGADIIRKDNISWKVNANITRTNNEIVKVNDIIDENGKPASDISNKWFIGNPINVYYDYAFDGIYQYSDFDLVDGKYILKPTVDSDNDGIVDAPLSRTDAVQPGMIKLKDINGDGKITDEDRIIINRDPKMIYSFSSTLKLYNFDLFVDMYATTGSTIMNPNLYDFNRGGTLQGRLNGIKVNYWTPDNPSNEYPYPSFSSTPTYISTLAYQNGSYFRIRTVTLGYNIPVAKRMSSIISNVRLYCTATNLLTLTKVLSYSPESSPSAYPEARQCLIGLNLTF